LTTVAPRKGYLRRGKSGQPIPRSGERRAEQKKAVPDLHRKGGDVLEGEERPRFIHFKGKGPYQTKGRYKQKVGEHHKGGFKDLLESGKADVRRLEVSRLFQEEEKNRSGC